MLRARLDQRDTNDASATPGTNGVRSAQTAELRWQISAPGQNALHLVASVERASDAAAVATLNELSLDRPLWGGFATLGKKVMSWDVGYAFRPLDVVQQEDRRALYAPTQSGVPMLAWEAFEAERALSLVWSNPGHGRAAQPRGDGALALRLYRRQGARDEYAVLRLSQRNGVEGGASFAQVVSDALELHGSALWQQRHDNWMGPDAIDALALSDPNRWQRVDGGGKVMSGMTWTTEGKFSLLAEAWLDRSAYSEQDWLRWRTRNAQLQARAPVGLRAANLGWNAGALQTSSLRQQNVLVRAAQNIGDVDAAFDVLWMPQDGGRITSAALSWKGAPWQLDASVRVYGGAAHSIARALPQRSAAVLSLQRAF